MTTTTTNHDKDIGRDGDFTPAVLFLSMASTAQTETAINGEPIRIQVQREAGHRMAIKLRAGIVKEFFEVGAARNWHKRPVLQKMMTYLQEHPEVTYAIFPASHRFSRTVHDAVELQHHFQELGVEVIFGHGPIGDLRTMKTDTSEGRTSPARYATDKEV